MSEDKRITKTKKALHNALINLLQTKHFNDLTVSEICSVADVNRATFYKYYTDIHELYHEYESYAYYVISSYIENKLPTDDFDNLFTKSIIRLCESKHEFYILTYEHKYSILEYVLLVYLNNKNYDKKKTLRYLAYHINGIIAYINNYFTNEYKEDSVKNHVDTNTLLDIIKT